MVKNLLLDIPTNQVIHEEKKYDLNVNIVIKKLLIDVPAKQVLSSDYYSQGKEIWFKCEYCDQKFAARCTTIHEEKKYDLLLTSE